jgi:hypothetical protein
MVNFTLLVPRRSLYTITLGSQHFELRPWQEALLSGKHHAEWRGNALFWRGEHTPHATVEDSGFRADAALDVVGYMDRTNQWLAVHATFNGIPTEESVSLSIRMPDGKNHPMTFWKHDTVAVLKETVRTELLLMKVSFADVHLFANGADELSNDSATMEQLGICDGHVVRCKLSLHGAIKASPKFAKTLAPLIDLLPERVAEWAPPFVRYNTKTQKTSEPFEPDHFLQPTGFVCLYDDVSLCRVALDIQLCDGHLVFKSHPDSDELVFPAASHRPITRVPDSHYSHSNNNGVSRPGYVDLEL